MSEEAEAIAPDIGLTGAEAQEQPAEHPQEQVSESQDDSYQLLSDDDPMLKTPDKFMNEDGTIDVEMLTKGYNNLEKLKSQKGFKAPDSIEGYEIASELPEGFVFDEERLTEIKKSALEKGVSNEQFNMFFEQYSKGLSDIASQLSYNPVKAEASLKEAWGDDSFDANLSLANKAAQSLSSVIPITEVKGNVPLIKVLAHFGSQMESDTAPSSHNTSASVDLNTEMTELQNSSDYFTNEAKQSRYRELLAKSMK